MPERPHLPIEKPSLETFVFEGEETPWLLRRRVIVGLLLAFAVIIAGYITTSQALGISYEIEDETFQQWVEDQGVLGPIAYILVMAVSVLVAPIPNTPVFMAAGLVWGPVVGTLYSLAGLLLGSTVAFWISRWAGRRHLPRLIGARAALKVDRAAESMGGRVIFWARMLPVINFDWVSFVAGLTAIRFRTYFLWSAAGMVLPTAVSVVAGDGLGRDVRITLSALGVWLLAVAVTAGYFWWRKRRWQRRQRAHEASVSSVTDSNGIGSEDAEHAGESLLATRDQ